MKELDIIDEISKYVKLKQSGNRNKRIKVSNWEYLVDAWNNNNFGKELPNDLEMPDYSKLPIDK